MNKLEEVMLSGRSFTYYGLCESALQFREAMGYIPDGAEIRNTITKLRRRGLIASSKEPGNTQFIWRAVGGK